MIIKRSKIYSGYEPVDGISYYKAQVGEEVADKLLDPADRVLQEIEDLSESYNITPSGKMTRIHKGIIKPLSIALKNNKYKPKSKKNKKKS